jgi:hypothetical protein
MYIQTYIHVKYGNRNKERKMEKKMKIKLIKTNLI